MNLRRRPDARKHGCVLAVTQIFNLPYRSATSATAKQIPNLQDTRLRAAGVGSTLSIGKLGFSLMELMVVLVLIGIMTAVIVPEMKGTYEDALLRATSRRLVDVFHIAYSRAVSLNQLHRVRFDKVSGRYFVESAVQ